MDGHVEGGYVSRSGHVRVDDCMRRLYVLEADRGQGKLLPGIYYDFRVSFGGGKEGRAISLGTRIFMSSISHKYPIRVE